MIAFVDTNILADTSPRSTHPVEASDGFLAEPDELLLPDLIPAEIAYLLRVVL